MTREKLEEQWLMAGIVEEADEAWNEMAEEHNIKWCGCFKDALVERLMKDWEFLGFYALRLEEDKRRVLETRESVMGYEG